MPYLIVFYLTMPSITQTIELNMADVNFALYVS